jgi:hypothetical protein
MPQLARTPKPIVLEKTVTVLHDLAWIAAHTELYINSLYSLEEGQIIAITDEIYRQTGFDVYVHTLPLDELLGHRLPLANRDRLNFMAGQPVWRLPAMFVQGAAGTSRNSPVGKTLNQAMAIQAVFGKAAIKALLEADYGRLKNRFPHGKWHQRADQHAEELIANALGISQLISRKGRIVDLAHDVERNEAGGPIRQILATKRYKFSAAQTIARNAIDNPHKKEAFGPEYRAERRPHIYKSNMERVEQEMVHAPNTFGFALDAVAIGAWYHRVVTALRLGASVFAQLDTTRGKVASGMAKANSEFQRLRRLGRPTEGDKKKMERLHAELAEQARLFDAEIGASLGEVNPARPGAIDRENVVFRCIEPLDAAIIAFFGGINARTTISGICPDFPQCFDDVLDSLIWLGHLHRHGARNLTSEIAHTLLSALNVRAGEAPEDIAMRRCVEIGMSFLNSREDQTSLVETIAEVASTGGPRTVYLSLQNFSAGVAAAEGRQQGGPEVHEAPQPADMLQIWPQEDDSQHYSRFNPELGTYQTISSELWLNARFVSLPPFYQQDWAGRWQVLRDEHDRFVASVRTPAA